MTDKLPIQVCMVFAAGDIFVVSGVNRGEPLSGPDAVCPGDIYALDAAADAQALWVCGPPGAQTVVYGSGIGTKGQPVETVARYTLMDDRGARVDLLVLRLGDGDRAMVALPLSPMAPDTDYTLLALDVAPGAVRLADVQCLSFGRGVRVTRADGTTCPIEDLSPNDLILTRDHGAQPLRWLGQATLRAVGPFAPVVIRAGVMGNLRDLVVSQQHRMFLYQGRARRNGPSEVLIQARHLIDDDKVFLRSGGFADYYALVFDRHEIIYAEGIPVESLLVSDATLSRLPPDLSEEMRTRFPGLSQSQHFGTEGGREVLDRRLPPDPQVA